MTTNDEYVERATTFNSDEAPNDERLDGYESLSNHYNRLSLANTLNWNGKWRDEERTTKQDASAILAATASQLELTDYQKSEAQRLLSRLPTKINQAYATPVIALCICGIVGKRDGRNYGPNAANTNIDIGAPDDYVDRINETNVSHAEFASCWNAVERGVQD